ncbi:hypothetical protein A9Q86_10395 [Flavobacteriales bacterium 33_180_T64]|nr:hypothetical protein A9Q86_10395 [Flavobacteriales bacterium 33_180_T64]
MNWKVLFLTKLFLVLTITAYSQSFENSTNVVDKSKFENIDNISNEGFSIPLYDINSEGLSLPIFLTYNTEGIKNNEVPSNVGLSWNLNVGGMISRELHGVPDEFEGISQINSQSTNNTIKGWFHDDWVMEGYSGNYVNSDLPNPDVILGHTLSTFHDNSPDLYNMHISNGDNLQFTFKKNFNDIQSQVSTFTLESKILSRSSNFLIEPNYTNLADESCSGCNAYGVTSDLGIEYNFEKGPISEVPFKYDDNIGGPLSSIGHYGTRDFYLKSIKSKKTTETINISYLSPNSLSQFELTAGLKIGGGSAADGETYWEDIIVRERNRINIDEITTSKETIKFEYINYQYTVSGPIYDNQINPSFNQTVQLVDKILVYDYDNNLVMGYKFNYLYLQGSDSKPILDKISRIANDGITIKLHRNFSYHQDNYLSNTLSPRQDSYGYSNEAYTNEQFDTYGYRNITPINYEYERLENGNSQPTIYGVSGADFTPSLNALKSGMLNSIITPSGGKTEIDYVINKSSTNYYGGLLVSSIKKTNNSGVKLLEDRFNYDDANGFGVPIYNGNNDWKNLYKKAIINPDINGFYYNISNRAYEFEDTDLQVSVQNNLNHFQDFGSFYKKITTKRIDVTLVNEVSNGYSVDHYKPDYSYRIRGRIPYRKEIYNDQDIMVQEQVFDYELIIKDEIKTIDLDNNHINKNCSGGISDIRVVEDPLYGDICLKGHRYILKSDYIYITEYILRSVEDKSYNSDATSSEARREYNYLDDNLITIDSKKVKSIENFYNGSSTYFDKTDFLYLDELSNIPSQFDNLLDYSNPVIQSVQWKVNSSDLILKSATINQYYSDGKLDKVYLTQGQESGVLLNELSYTNPYYDSSNNFITVGMLNNSFHYDSVTGKIISKINYTNGINEYYQRTSDYNSNYVDAVLSFNDNSITDPNGLFVRLSFEDLSASGTQYFNNAFSGNNIYVNNSLNIGNYGAGYTISYWEYISGKWTYREQEHSGGNVTINKTAGALGIDEVRVYPKNGVIESMNFKPSVGLLSMISQTNNVIKNHYDEFSRLIYQTDQNSDVVNEVKYNLINE